MAAQLAHITGSEHTALLGLGVYRPQRIVSNDEVAGPIDSSDEWIRTRSGIHSRRFATGSETIVTMSADAARGALESARIAADQIDCVILATSTWALLTPAAAPQVATALGMNHPPAFDLAAGCAGFCHGLAVASDLIKGGTARHVLVVGVELLSATVNPADRATAFLFGDGAGAVVVGPAAEPGIGPTVWGSDGTQHHAIRQDKDWVQFFAEFDELGADAVRPWLAMEGTAVFRWAAHSLKQVCLDAVGAAGLVPGDLEAMVPHQANGRIIEIMARELKLSPSCALADDITEAGNTSAASIPLAMEALLRKGDAKPGADALLVAFGAGLSWAAQVVKLPNWQ
ncbi:beta-ketoacyl-ACP synthase III [Nocardia sp. alder85J]|uniref:beta-ketoacyl-ACP synthase III n=1 Tax=Nocardia sp. alder85J TaxID=2862949 RepID=UPI001CD68075|nr:beta-ketoacyl-ACP synthase III [Nocardia sp. alder85J]MCX4098998.1 ketoacyl-ACP synthase III [Nocardia sp. alder85J]